MRSVALIGKSQQEHSAIFIDLKEVLWYLKIGALLTTQKTNMSPENSGWKTTFLLKWLLFRRRCSFDG